MHPRFKAAALATLMTLGLGMATVQAPAQAAGPDIQWDYSMPDNIGPTISGVVGPPGNEQDLTGMYVPQNKMTADPDYPIAGNALYGSVPTDGKYPVTLDACATKVSGNATYQWTIDGGFYASSDCKVTQKLTEGTKNYTLAITDDTGSSQVSGTFVVQDTLVVIMGDSYASGEGFPPFYKDNIDPTTGKPYDQDFLGDLTSKAKYIGDWDETSCQRSRWSGFVRAAAQMEADDPHSSVTVINVTCAGAQMTENKEYFSFLGTTGGVLYPKRALNAVGQVDKAVLDAEPTIPAQIDQINALRKGQKIDATMLSIGGNDLGLQFIMAGCIGSMAYDASCFDGIWEPVNDAMNGMPQKFAQTAACLGQGDCKTMKPGSKQMTASPSLGINPADVIQAGYPSLLRGSDGQFCNRSGYDTSDWDTEVDSTNWSDMVTTLHAPFKYSDAQWGEQVMLFGDGKPKAISQWQGTAGSPWIPTDTGPVTDVDASAKGLVGMFMDNSSQYGWTLATEPFTTTVNKGICADPKDTVLYPVGSSLHAGYAYSETDVGDRAIEVAPLVGAQINDLGVLHPNNRGQEVYRSAMYTHTKEQAGLPVPAKTQHDTTPVPPPINAVTKVKVKTLKPTCGNKYCHVRISFTAPTDGLAPAGYKVKVKVKGGKWKVIRSKLEETSTVWKQGPWKKKSFSLKIGAYAWGPEYEGTKVQLLNWTKAKSYKIKK